MATTCPTAQWVFKNIFYSSLIRATLLQLLSPTNIIPWSILSSHLSLCKHSQFLHTVKVISDKHIWPFLIILSILKTWFFLAFKTPTEDFNVFKSININYLTQVKWTVYKQIWIQSVIWITMALNWETSSGKLI